MSDNQFTWEEAVKWLRQQPEKKELVHQCYYDDPILLAAERYNQSQEWLAVLKLLKKYLPAKVLDLGAGRGISSFSFSKNGCDVTALEPDSSDIVGVGAIQTLIKSAKLPIKIVQNFGEALPFEDGSFEIVYGRAILHHANDLQKICQEASRVLRPGGVFLATREHVVSKREDLQTFLDSHALHYLYGGENAYLLDEYISAIQGANLELNSLLGPSDSVINYAPTSKEQFASKISSKLKVYLGEYLSNRVSEYEIVHRIYGRWLSSRSHVPGRHYTFLAIKK